MFLMRTNLMAVEHSRSNSFDFLRVSAALLVLYSHSFSLVGLPEPASMAGQSYGSLAVALFFAINGYLVCQSWVHDPSPLRFVVRRALRILPGWGSLKWLAALAISIVVTCVLAMLSWILVEWPALAQKSRLVGRR
jgi:peptidoglycan/LPS O-acetylase OafA/YrhL